MGPQLLVASEFDAFYEHHRERLIAALDASTRCGPDLATDAVDEAFVRALARWKKGSAMAAPAGWVFVVARNVVNRSRARRSAEDALLRRERSAGVTAIDPGLEAQWALWDLVAELPDREREAVALRYLADLTEPEIAAAMSIAVGTVSATLHRARKHLAQRLAESALDDSPESELAAGPATDQEEASDA